MASSAMTIRKKVSVTKFRDHLSENLGAAKGASVVLVENRTQDDKYVVDKNWLDGYVKEREAILATLEILADQGLTERLLKTAMTIKEDARAGKFRTMEQVFGEA